MFSKVQAEMILERSDMFFEGKRYMQQQTAVNKLKNYTNLSTRSSNSQFNLFP